MDRKRFIITALTGILLVLVLFFVFLNEKHMQNIDEKSQNAAEKQMNEEVPEDEEETLKAQTVPAVKEKIELTDYAHLPLEEFMEETGIALEQQKDNLWETEDGSIWVETDGSRITEITIDRLIYDDETGKFSIDEEWFPYTLAGISPNDELSELKNSILDGASELDGDNGYYYYSSLYLSKLGIERLTLLTLGDKSAVNSLYADIDMSLKENAEGLEYSWKEETVKKTGTQNDKLTETDSSYAEAVWQYKESEKIDRTAVWITYPCLEIVNNVEMTQNANGVISEAVKKIENNTYGKTNENIIVEADYTINYISSRFISITFMVNVTSGSKKERFWQRCNINTARNGEKAYLADLGYTKEEIARLCSTAGIDPADIDAYLESYDTNWDQFSIRPMEYVLFVKKQNEEGGFDTVSIHKSII